MIGPLLATPQRYRFTQLVTLLLRILRRQGVPYARAFSQVLRFRNSVSLAFPASEVEGLTAEPAAAIGPSTSTPGPHRIVMTPAFIGLLGAMGTLPLHDTERAAMGGRSGADDSWQPFVDLLSNRIIGLFYEAWGKYRVEHGIGTRGQDDLLPLLSALCGFHPTRFGPGRCYTALSAETAGFYAGLLGTRPVAASTMERVLGDYFGVPMRLEEFVGAWDALPARMQSTLGVTEPVLGHGAALGKRLWRNDVRVRLCIGPLDEETARGFLPNGSSWMALRDMIGLLSIPAVQYEIRVLLDKPSLKPLVLRTQGQDRKRLGWSSFLTGTVGKASRADIRSVFLPATGQGNRSSALAL